MIIALIIELIICGIGMYVMVFKAGEPDISAIVEMNNKTEPSLDDSGMR